MSSDICKVCIPRPVHRIVDPAMADSGKLYPAFDMDFVEAAKSLVAVADVTLPNITEAFTSTARGQGKLRRRVR